MNIHFNFYLQCIKKILEVSCLDIGVTSFTINFHLVQLVLGQVSKKNYRNIAEIKKKERERTTSYPFFRQRMLNLQGDQWKQMNHGLFQSFFYARRNWNKSVNNLISSNNEIDITCNNTCILICQWSIPEGQELKNVIIEGVIWFLWFITNRLC